MADTRRYRTHALAALRRASRTAGGARARALVRTAATPYLRWRLHRDGGSLTNASGRRLYLDPDDAGALLLYWMKGTREPHVTTMWRGLVDAVRPQLAVDVGANYGEVILAASYPSGCRVVAIEANPAVFTRLERSVREGLGDQVEVHRVAATDTDGEIDFWVSRRSSGLGSLVRSSRSDPEATPTRVPGRRLDSLLQGTEAQRIVFKIDVEGAELAVLRGMSDLLSRAEIAAGICEFAQIPRVDRAALTAEWHCYAIDRRGVVLHRLSAEEAVRAPSRIDSTVSRDVLVSSVPVRWERGAVSIADPSS